MRRMTGMRIGGALLLAPVCLAAITNLRVAGTTATQAVIEYTAPSVAACTVEVSESAGYAPVVHDVDPALFAGSNRDDRGEAVMSGPARVFVIGKRVAEKRSDGKYYSRALQAYTTHYFRVTCGADTGTGSFRTTNIPLGGTYNDPIPADPSKPGETAWPTLEWDVPSIPGASVLSSTGTTVTSTGHGLAAEDFIVLTSGPKKGEVRQVATIVNGDQALLKQPFSANQTNASWAKRTPEKVNSAQTVVDPQTGLLLRRITAPAVLSGNADERDSGIESVQDQGSGTWTNATTAALNSAGDGQAASCTGSACHGAWLVVRAAMWAPITPVYAYAGADVNQLDYMRILIRGGVSGGAGDDAKLEYCLTIDGVSCVTAIKEVDLTSCGSADCVLGDERPVMKYWEDPADPLKARVPRPDIFLRTGTADYDAGTRTLTWKSGQYFNPRWTNGSRMTLNGTAYPVESVLDYKRLTLASGPATGTGYTFTAVNFGVMFRKKTTAANSVSLDYVRFKVGLSDGMRSLDGGYAVCAKDKVSQTYNGITRWGYHCIFMTNWGGHQLWWIDADSADAAYLGDFYSRKAGEWPGSVASLAAGNWGWQDSSVVYGGVTRTDGTLGVVKIQYQGDNLAKSVLGATGNQLTGSTWTQILPVATPVAIQTFAASDPGGPAFDPALDNQCSVASESDVIAAKCLRGGGQDHYGWVAVVDPASSQVVAATTSHGYFPLRNCIIHGASATIIGGKKVAQIVLNPWWGGSSCGMGPLVTESVGPLPATGAESCPANPFASMALSPGHGCSTVEVTGEPYDPSPCASENSNRGAAGPYGALQVAQPGDVFTVGSEKIQLLAKNGTQWTFLRGWNGTAVAAHGGASSLSGFCSAIVESAAALFWDYQADPHGRNTGLTSILYNFPRHGGTDRGTYDRGVYQVSGNEWCKWMYSGGCYAVFDGASTIHAKFLTFGEDRVMNVYPLFAGARGHAVTPIGSHVAYTQTEPGQGDWALDEWAVNFAELESGEWANVSGTLYRKNKTGLLDRKQLPTRASCGEHPLVDISGPSSTIADGASDNYKYCAAERAGECYPGSAVGDVYVNCPYVNMTHCSYGGQDACNGSGNEQCSVAGEETNVLQDICAYNSSPWLDSVIQFGLTGYVQDRSAWRTRWLSRHLGRYRRIFPNANANVLPDGSWALFHTRWLDGVRTEFIAGKLPPMPALGEGQDSAARWTFTPVVVRAGAAPAGVSGVSVEFGYDPAFRCTSRQESCVAVGATVNEAAPFYWASDSYSGASCGPGCTIAIPAIPQRILYYRWRLHGVDGAVISTGPTQIAVTP